MRSPEEIGGNYGVEVTDSDELVILDLDDMTVAAENGIGALPTTLSTKSPHGGRHLYYHVPGWREAFTEAFGVANPHPSYGEIRSGDGYVVGAGSELTGCDYDDCCSEESPGEYELVDEPIASVDAQQIVEVIDRD
jgi:hypothetical protein